MEEAAQDPGSRSKAMWCRPGWLCRTGVRAVEWTWGGASGRKKNAESRAWRHARLERGQAVEVNVERKEENEGQAHLHPRRSYLRAEISPVRSFSACASVLSHNRLPRLARIICKMHP